MPYPATPCLKAFDAETNPDRRNRMLLAWLSDDDTRAQLFQLISQQRQGSFEFPSRDAAPEAPCCPSNENPRPPPETGHRQVRLVTNRDEIETALRDGGQRYSSRPYAELGGGKFLLALDPAGNGAAAHAGNGAAAHAAQSRALCHAFRHYSPDLLARVAHQAGQAAAILSMRGRNFDLADFAEQCALRFCQGLFGYARGDHRLLEKSLRASYRALVYQVLGRHFVTDPLAIPEAQQTMGALLLRTAELIDAYAVGDREADALKGCEASGAMVGQQRVLELLAACAEHLNGEQRAVIAAGAVAGTVGNVQAAVCVAVKACFTDPASWAEARSLATTEDPDRPSASHPRWRRLIARALRENPPIAYLPRVDLAQKDDQGRFVEVLLALGGGTQAAPTQDPEDPLIWGLPAGGKHWCLGKDLAWPLIIEAVRHVMGLPGLEQRLDPLTAQPEGLDKRWGFACERYPLTHRRDRRVAQSCLNVAMRIRQPVKDHAARLRQVITAGAPRIHEALREARHLHFAWFEFIERDTVLVLHTVYDGDFDAYIQHFALRVGDLFDLLFESIEDAPPMPVAKFPDEFVALIRRYNRAPAMGYFFSAYPYSEAARIMRDEASRRQRELEARKAEGRAP